MKLSIIVPIYNVEAYLRKCVDSLLHQDYDNYEIILVDDGSTDNSGKLADELASQIGDSRFTIGDFKPEIRVIHQENRGLSGARNTGIKEAKGEYVCFVDSDDYWEENVMAELMAQIKRDKLDVLRFDYRNINEQYQEIWPNKSPKKYNDFSEQVCGGDEFLNNRLGFNCYAPLFIVRKNILIPHNNDTCLFTEGIYFEDTDWTPRMLMRASRVASSSRIVYNYLWRVGSITLAVDSSKKRKLLEDKMYMLRGFVDKSKKVVDDSWYKWQISASVLSILSIISKDFFTERDQYIQQIKQLNILPISTYRASKNSMVKIAIVNFSIRLYCLIYKLLF